MKMGAMGGVPAVSLVVRWAAYLAASSVAWVERHPRRSPRPRVSGRAAASRLRCWSTRFSPCIRRSRARRASPAPSGCTRIISKSGSVESLEVMSGHPLLVRAAMDAVQQWKYKPTLLNGEPVEVDTTIDVIFSLNQ